MAFDVLADWLHVPLVLVPFISASSRPLMCTGARMAHDTHCARAVEAIIAVIGRGRFFYMKASSADTESWNWTIIIHLMGMSVV